MVALVNNHVLFPELANWAELPEWRRTWQNEIFSAVTGAEARQALRAQPRVSLTFTITPLQLPDLARFDDRIRAAKKSGKACAPYAGRGYVLQADVDADTATLDRPWNSDLGAYIFLATAGGLYEVRTIIDTPGDDIVLDQAVARTYPAQTFAWPLIFGKFVADSEMAARSPRLGPMRLTIQELISPASLQLGAVMPPAGAGIGVMTIGSTFTIAPNYLAGVAGETLAGVAGETLNPI